jgi:hypothetical protein|tara:strand:+ start:175 stop:423 length:249 start_codon:yes stop_codon:yes gene_type:complete
MKYVLIDKNTREVVDRKDLSDEIGLSGARTFFQGVKQIDDKSFTKLWEVMTESDYKSKKLQRNPGYIKWWKEENSNLDIGKE